MTPAFSSWTAFFAMGGYGFFVWLAACITIISLSGLVIYTVYQRKLLLADLKRRRLRQQRVEQARINEKGGI